MDKITGKIEMNETEEEEVEDPLNSFPSPYSLQASLRKISAAN